jgi:transaldolase
MNSIKKAQFLGQDIWLDYIQRDLLRSGQFDKYIEQGISGVTSNPTIFEKAITGSNDYDESLLMCSKEGYSSDETYEKLALEDIGRAADMMSPVFKSSSGRSGYVSIEVSPMLAYDTDKTVEEGKRLFKLLGRPNIMIKVPATVEGLPAIRQLIAESINVNVTLLFSIERCKESAIAYIRGLKDLADKGGDVSRISSVASLFLSRIDTMVDSLLEESGYKEQKTSESLFGKAALATAKLAYQEFKELFNGKDFRKLQEQGAKIQRLLWASTSTKNPAYSDLLYVEPLIGVNTVNTLPPKTIQTFLAHGSADDTVEKDINEARRVFESMVENNVDMESVANTLLDKGVQAFITSFKSLSRGIEEKSKELLQKESG